MMRACMMFLIPQDDRPELLLKELVPWLQQLP